MKSTNCEREKEGEIVPAYLVREKKRKKDAEKHRESAVVCTC